MSTSFSKKFLALAENVATSLGATGSPGNLASRVNKSALSANAILAGDVLFFKYRSRKWGVGDHMAMVVGNKRGPYGIFQHKGKRYLSSVKLNSMWSFTSSLIIKEYRNKEVKYTPDTKKMKKAFMSLVGRKNYRTYIMNNMYNAYEIGDREE